MIDNYIYTGAPYRYTEVRLMVYHLALLAINTQFTIQTLKRNSLVSSPASYSQEEAITIKGDIYIFTSTNSYAVVASWSGDRKRKQNESASEGG